MEILNGIELGYITTVSLIKQSMIAFNNTCLNPRSHFIYQKLE